MKITGICSICTCFTLFYIRSKMDGGNLVLRPFVLHCLHNFELSHVELNGHYFEWESNPQLWRFSQTTWWYILPMQDPVVESNSNPFLQRHSWPPKVLIQFWKWSHRWEPSRHSSISGIAKLTDLNFYFPRHILLVYFSGQRYYFF